MMVNGVPLLSVQICDWAEALHLNLLWELVLHLTLSKLFWQQVGLWESMWAARRHKAIWCEQEALWLREQHKSVIFLSVAINIINRISYYK